ncbi:TonB-dependent receptor [Reichenbachiella sp. MALMAid0571]|uniref:SusC/RagA family TonB-linked outer membrane protein n=1 Tax=Reichenbachiella sp. MALMAid0571 TaxID=3143939 RepID=UPI0032DF4276
MEINKQKLMLMLALVVTFFQFDLAFAKAEKTQKKERHTIKAVLEDVKISGKVTDEKGEGLPGASIVVKGTTTGTTTDLEGKYSFIVPEEAILNISFVGYLKQEIPVNNRNVIDIKMVPDAEQLNEVVVVGYGTQKKSDITGSVSSVKAETLQNLPLARTDETLQGQVAGVRIQNNDASPNAAITIRIRGVSSINGGNNPLIVIDGIQGVNLKDIHPNDIESIEVLKDASATAIYGSRGAGGVVLVTTKKGKSRKPSITYNTYGSLTTVRNKLELLDVGQYAEVTNANRISRNLPAVYTDEQIAEFKQNGGTDWQDEIFRPAYTHNHHLTISGGNDEILYSIAGDYLETEGVVIGSSYKKYAFRPNFSADLSRKLKFTLNTFASWSTDHPIELNNRDREGSPIYAAPLFPPTKPVYKDDGAYSQPGGGVGSNTEYNPVALALEPVRDNLQNQLIVSPTLQYEIVEGLTVSTMISHQLVTNNNGRYINEKIVNGGESDRQASVSNSRWNSFQNSNIVSYEKEFNDKHNLKLTSVFEQQRQVSTSNWSGARDFLTNAVLYNDLSLGAQSEIPSSNRTEQSLESYMGRINYSYAGKYLLTLTGRSDGSSVFAANNKRAFFPSLALGWNVTNESFMENSQLVSNLKVRASYGEVGNAAISPYQSLAQLVTGSNFSFTGSDVTTGINLSTQAPNPDLKWETTRQANLGVDLELFDGRLSLVADYYEKNTKDLLLSRALYQASGFQTQLINAGEVENKGVEVQLSGNPIVGDFKWNTGITFSRNVNKVISLNDGETSIQLGDAGLPGFSDALWIEVGQPLGLVKGYEYAGVWKSTEAVLAAGYGVTPGSPKYVDQNNDGIINNDDVVNIANTLPEFTFGWNNFFSYKSFDLSVLVQGVQGNDIYNIGRSRIDSNDEGTSIRLLNAWTEDNENTNIPAHNGLGGFRNDSRWVESGAYIRVKNISVGYRFPSSVLESLGVSSARIYATGTNLFTFTDYTGYDPEGSTNVDSRGGIDYATFPSQKKYTISLDIKF